MNHKEKDYKHYVSDFVYNELEEYRINTGKINDLFIKEKYYDIPLWIRIKFLDYVCKQIGVRFEFVIKQITGAINVINRKDQIKIDQLNSICYYGFRNSLFTNPNKS